MLRKQGMRPLLVATDVARPAAIQQLQVVGDAVQTPVYQLGTRVAPVDIVRGAQTHARATTVFTHVIVDTAGRLHINEELMDEVAAMRDVLAPQEVLLVLDAMTGQDAVNVAEQFHARLSVTGFILTKMDGDTRGGAALSRPAGHRQADSPAGHRREITTRWRPFIRTGSSRASWAWATS